MAKRDEQAIPTLIGDLYEGTADPFAWRRAMQRLADLVRGNETLLIQLDPTGVLAASAELVHHDRAVFAEYATRWLDQDLRIAPALRAPPLEPQFELRLRCWREHRASAFYNEFLTRHDFASFLCTWLEKDQRGFVALSIQGSPKRGPFEQRDAERLGPILPHVRRALCIRRRLQDLRLRADTLDAALDRAPFGVIVLDEAGTVVEVNAAAEDLVRCDPALAIDRRGKLRLAGNAGKLLRRRIAEATRSGTGGGILRVGRDRGPPLSVVLAPLPLAASIWGGSQRRWLLLLGPERPLDPSVIADDLDLSPREAEVVAAIAGGLDLATVARELGISLQTVRTHLKAVYGKTGLHTRGQLLHRVLTGAASLCGPSADPADRGAAQPDGGAIGARSAE